jgi:hypothetical protein
MADATRYIKLRVGVSLLDQAFVEVTSDCTNLANLIRVQTEGFRQAPIRGDYFNMEGW